MRTTATINRSTVRFTTTRFYVSPVCCCRFPIANGNNVESYRASCSASPTFHDPKHTTGKGQKRLDSRITQSRRFSRAYLPTQFL